jgi:O-antigen/teichoic acid export membrane protein
MNKANFINKYSFFVNDAVTYGLILAFSKCAALISTFILARYLKVEEYGVFDYYLVLSVAFVSIFAFGQDSAIARFFYEYDDDTSRKQLISQSLFFQLIVSFFMAPFVLLLDYFLNFTPLNDNSFEYLFVIVLMVPFIILFNSAQNIRRFKHEVQHGLRTA